MLIWASKMGVNKCQLRPLLICPETEFQDEQSRDHSHAHVHVYGDIISNENNMLHSPRPIVSHMVCGSFITCH